MTSAAAVASAICRPNKLIYLSPLERILPAGG